ncbi:hypothetical protein [Actinomadura gamaensis]|uniref:Tetracyclin repressor-like C-terminal domain-containing protein n=1 Tax=Actinomadura gamaensis TaxID=1763541 RepID=A0ABV9TZI7_9ACTN
MPAWGTVHFALVLSRLADGRPGTTRQDVDFVTALGPGVQPYLEQNGRLTPGS